MASFEQTSGRVGYIYSRACRRVRRSCCDRIPHEITTVHCVLICLSARPLAEFMQYPPDQSRIVGLSLRVLEGRVLNLIVEVAPLVVADEVRADVLVAGALGRPGLILEATQKGHCNILFEVNARILIDDLLSQIFWKMLITDTQHIESDTVVEKLHLERFVS